MKIKFFSKKVKKPKLRNPINFRKWTRFIFRLLLVGLIVSSCVQSLTWMGHIGMETDPKYAPIRHHYYDDEYTNTSRSSTRHLDVREVDTTQVTREIEEPPYNDYNRHYGNGEYR